VILIFTARCICISRVYAVTRCLSVCLSVTFVSCAKTNKDIFEIVSPSGSHTILVFPYQTGWRYSDGNPPNWASNARGYEKLTIFDQYLALSQKQLSLDGQLGTCSETICKHRILFPSIQHLAWLPRGVPRGNKNVVKIAIFGLTHWLKHRITRKLLKIDRYMLRGVWQALNCLSIHATYCVIITGASSGETTWPHLRCDVGLEEGEHRENRLCLAVLCTIIMVHKGTSSSYRSVNCIGHWSCLV